MFNSNNPALSAKAFQGQRTAYGADAEVMTIKGTVDRVYMLLAIILATGCFGWVQTLQLTLAQRSSPWLWVGVIGGFVAALATIFKPSIAKFSAPIYAAFEGLFLGSFSVIFEMKWPGIAFQAFLGTVAVFGTMFYMYRSETIRVTPKLQKGVMAAVLGIGGIYLLTIILNLFGMSIPFIHGNGPIGILFSVIVVGVAAFALLLDFDRIEEFAKAGVPKHMEWYAAFGLVVTLVWLYVEILILLSKLRGVD